VFASLVEEALYSVFIALDDCKDLRWLDDNA